MKIFALEEYGELLKERGNTSLWIVGAGKYGEIFGKYFDRHGIAWDGYIDRRVRPQKVNGKDVYAYEIIDKSDCYYVISSFQYRIDMEDELRKRGVEENRIITYEDQNVFYDLYDDLIQWRQYSNKIQTFFERYAGERCFLIGNGPSLRTEDLNCLTEEFCFASNTIYALYDSSVWRPDFYCAWDPVFCKETMSDKESMQRLLDGCGAMFTSILGEGIKYRESLGMQRLYYMRSMSCQSKDDLPLFSDDCSKQVYSSGSITYGMLQLAVYMGFQRIYLLGMDFNYSVEKYDDNTVVKKDVMNHMPEIEAEEKRFYQAISERYDEKYVAEMDQQLKGYQSAKKYADEHGIQIYNATRGGKLEVFPRVDFDSLFD